MPFSKSSLHNANQLNLLYIDFWGPSSVLLIDYKLYYILFVDQYSIYTWLFTLKDKTEVLEIFQTLHHMLEKHCRTKNLFFYTDGGGEFQNLDSYLKTHVIKHQCPPPHTRHKGQPQLNPHRHVIETTHTFLHQETLTLTFQSYECHQAVYMINRMTTLNLQNKSPFELLFQVVPKYDYIKVFNFFILSMTQTIFKK